METNVLLWSIVDTLQQYLDFLILLWYTVHVRNNAHNVCFDVFCCNKVLTNFINIFHGYLTLGSIIWLPQSLCNICEIYRLTPQQLEMQGCILTTVATDALVLKHQIIIIHCAD